MKKIVFNSSLPRSGSTLLQNILAQNPRFYCTPTSGLINILQNGRQMVTKHTDFLAQDREIVRRGFLGYCEGAMQGYFSALTEQEVCVDKSRSWLGEYEWLASFHPNPKILVTIRDLRAIVSSMEKRWHARPYFHRDELDMDPTGLKMATLENRISYWMSTNPVGSNLAKLMGAVQLGHVKKFHIVRFEELTTQSQQIMNGIYDYLEEPRFEHNFNHVEQTTHENDAYRPVYSDHVIRSEVKQLPVDYQDVLTKTLANTLKQQNGEFFATFYPGK